MSLKTIPALDAAGLRKFAFSTAIAIVILFAIAIPWLFGLSYPLWPWILSGVLVLLGMITPRTLNPVYKIWMKFGILMSRITTPIILGIVFFLVITPIAIGMRIFGRDILKLKINKDASTHKVKSTVPDYKSTMNRPF